ncbi:MAG: tetratricopeptide repeat protein [Ramlibacter sp.]|nr:tetratricopeptide repeat protein [Ramlibacter sp.]
MKHSGIAISCLVRTLGLAVAICLPLAAFADDYAEVSRLMRAGKPAEAIARADQYLAAKPKDPQMRFIKGVAQAESGRTADALNTFTRITEEYPELPEPYNNLAVLYAGQGQFDEARATLEAAIRTNPSYSTAHENLGDVYAKLASQAYSKALQLDATNTGLQPKLALIRELFTPGKGRPAAGPVAVPAPAVVAAAAPAVVAKAPVAAPPPSATPPVATPPGPAPSSSTGSQAVEAAVQAWAAAWSSKDMGAYLGAYGKEFDPPGNMSRKAWEEERRARIVGKSKIAVKLNDVSVAVKGTTAVARFKQTYSADSLNVSSRKTLELVKSGDRWVIVRESTGA